MQLVDVTKDKDGIINGSVIGVTTGDIIGDFETSKSTRGLVNDTFSHVNNILQELKKMIDNSMDYPNYFKTKAKLTDGLVNSILEIENVVEKLSELRDEEDESNLFSIAKSFSKRADGLIETIKSDKDEHLAINALIKDFNGLYTFVDEALAFEEECIKTLKADKEHPLFTKIEIAKDYEFDVDVHSIPTLKGLIPGLSYNRYKSSSRKYIKSRAEKDFYSVMEKRDNFFNLGKKMFAGSDETITMENLKKVAQVGNFLSYAKELKDLWFKTFEDNRGLSYYIMRSQSEFYQFMYEGFVPAILEVEREISQKLSEIGYDNLTDAFFEMTVEKLLNKLPEDENVAKGILSSDLREKYSEVINKSDRNLYKTILLEVREGIKKELGASASKGKLLVIDENKFAMINSPTQDIDINEIKSLIGSQNIHHEVRVKDYFIEKLNHIETVKVHVFSIVKPKPF